MLQSNNSSGHRPNQTMPYYGHIRLLSLQLLLTLVLFGSTIRPSASQIIAEEEQLETPYYYVGCFTERIDLFKESIYAKTPQTCIDICENLAYAYAVLSAERCFCSNSTNHDERQDENLCNIRCMANKAQQCGGVGVHSYYSTKVLSKVSAPSNVRIANVTEHSLTVMWDKYQLPKVIIAGDSESTMTEQRVSNFLIKSQVVHTYSSLPFFQQPEFIVQSTETRFEITDLQPATEYNVTVAAMCGNTVCGRTSVRGTTEVGVPEPEPAQPRILNTDEHTITVEIPPIRNDNGPVTSVLVIVEHIDASLSQTFDTELLGSWQKAQDDGLPYYIAAQLDYQRPEDNQTRLFVVGDDKRYGPYTNPPLDKEKDAHVHISLGVVSTLNGVTKTLFSHSSHEQHETTMTMDDFTYATFDSGRESIIALSVTCIVFGTCLILSLITYFYLRYKTYQARSGANRSRNTHELTLQQPIIERENNGFVVEDEIPTVENFKQQLNTLLDSLDASKRLPRNALRMNVNDVLAEGRYGEVITGKLITANAIPDVNSDCQLHVLALDDLNGKDQAHLLQEFRYLTRLQRHEHILDFYGVSSSADWFYFVFEHQSVSLKRRLIESRRAPNSAPVQRISALSEELVLQWIYQLATAMEYLSATKVVHKQLCSHSVFVTAEAKVKIGLFGPIPYVSNQKKIDLSRWLSPEALRYQHYSSKGDVWSFGCVAWECCTLGATPYANINNSQHLLDAIKSGARPAQPTYVFQDLYQLLLNCWTLEPSERIAFDEIAFNVRQLMTSPRHALCFDRMPETPGNNVVDMLPYYMPMLETIN